jgi:hypothetical protein
VNADEREEITASVAAHAELGPKYDSAVAEGLIERIGEEIDKRVDARLRGLGQPAPEPPTARQSYLSPGQQIVPPGYQGQPGYRGPSGYPGQSGMPGPAAHAVPGSPPALAPTTGPVPARRSNGVTGMILGLGSMGLGVGATAVVVSHAAAAGTQIVMVLLIWAVIAVINIAHSQRR